MAALYDDVRPPVRICGYASVFGVTYLLGGSLERIRPDAFDTTRHQVFAAFMHDPGWRIGWTRDRSLSLWQDHFGLAFRLDVPSTHQGLGLVAGVKRGHFRGCSFNDGGDRAVASDLAVADGREVRVIRRLTVSEVSICPAGANPEATCWVDDEDPADLPSNVRHTPAQWHEGLALLQLRARQDAQVRARARASAKPQALSDQVVDRIVAGWRPRGWAWPSKAFARG